MEQEKEHKRRVRYKGTHPRSYREKYKELNPEKYQQDVEKIIQSGKTPAGMHIPICVNEILEFLNIQHKQLFLQEAMRINLLILLLFLHQFQGYIFDF